MSDNKTSEPTETWLQAVKAMRPELNLSDEATDYILWNETAFPFAKADEVLRQARQFVEGMKSP